MMKYIAFGLITFLAFIVFWKENRINELSSEIKNLKDTLITCNFKWNPHENKILFDSLHEPLFVSTNDSIYEIHRIFFGFSQELYIVKVECLIDSTYNIIFKKGSICNPVTKIGICKLEKETTNKLNKVSWSIFKNKLKIPDIYDLTLWIENMSSLGPVLEWEAALGYQTFHFDDNDGFHRQFSEACGFLLNQVNDEDFHKMLTKFTMD